MAWEALAHIMFLPTDEGLLIRAHSKSAWPLAMGKVVA